MEEIIRSQTPTENAKKLYQHNWKFIPIQFSLEQVAQIDKARGDKKRAKYLREIIMAEVIKTKTVEVK